MIWILGSRGVPARYGGFETLAEQLQRHLMADGLECTVVGTQDHTTMVRTSVRLLRRFGPTGAMTPVATWITRPRVAAGDGVLVVNPVNVWTARSLQRRGAQVLLHLDGMEDRRAKWGWIARRVHRLARRSAVRSDLTLIADSREIQRIYLEQYGRATEYIAYGGCPIAEADSTHRWSPERAGGHFLVMARPEPENQVLEICEAFAQTSVEAQLAVVGGPARTTPYWRRIEQVAASDPRISLLGPIWERGRLCELMMTARAYIHGHTVGGTNPSLVDVLSHGTPVLVHLNTFNLEVLGKSSSTWRDAADLAERLCSIQGEPIAPPGTSNYRWAEVVSEYRRLLLAGLS